MLGQLQKGPLFWKVFTKNLVPVISLCVFIPAAEYADSGILPVRRRQLPLRRIPGGEADAAEGAGHRQQERQQRRGQGLPGQLPVELIHGLPLLSGGPRAETPCPELSVFYKKKHTKKRLFCQFI